MKHNFGLNFELIEELNILDFKIINGLKNECEELIKVMSKYKFTLSQNQQNK